MHIVFVYRLAGNQELCSILATTIYLEVCTSYVGITGLQGNNSSSNSQAPNLTCHSCSPPSMPVFDVASQVCQCAHLVAIQLISPSFSFFGSYFTQTLISLLEVALNISASQVQIQSPDWVGERLTLNLLLFPPNSTTFSSICSIFSNFTLSSSSSWSLSPIGPYELLNCNAGWFSSSSSFLLIHNLPIKWFCSNNH